MLVDTIKCFNEYDNDKHNTHSNKITYQKGDLDEA